MLVTIGDHFRRTRKFACDYCDQSACDYCHPPVYTVMYNKIQLYKVIYCKLHTVNAQKKIKHIPYILKIGIGFIKFRKGLEEAGFSPFF